MARRKQDDSFQVEDFLQARGRDDMRSALTSLLRPGPPADTPASAAPSLEPGLDLAPGIGSGTGVSLQPGPTAGEVFGRIAAGPGAGHRRFAIREANSAQDPHTRTERHVYARLWQGANPLDEVSRTITIGFGALAKLVDLSESNARLNVRSLAAKLALEEHEAYDCARSIGRTYRVFSEPEILRRRREAGLLWYMRRTVAVVFVDPRTGQPIRLPRAHAAI